jgi:HSP20 family protein
MAQDARRSQESLVRRRGTSDSLVPLSPEDLFRMNPFQLMRHFSDEMDRMWRRGDEMSSWRPAVDVREHNGQLQVHAELPGVNEKDVKVAIENDALIIQGERKREEEREEQGWYRAERSYGSFYRAIPLPEGAEGDKANARFNNGVLEITMPVAKGQQHVRQIPISTAGQATQSGQGPQEKSSRAGVS